LDVSQHFRSSIPRFLTYKFYFQEFGAVTGIFEPDEQTMEFVGARRRAQKHKRDAVYFKADPDAEYADVFEVDLSKVESFVAVPPSPDNVVPVSEVVGTRLDGTFIGACTTAEEDLVMAALVLKAGLERGQKPVNHGRRLVVPGSKPIRHKLEKTGLLDVYRQAGFKVGVPGCSMCVGQGVDQAAPGEVWMSSQNRNFPNRMGPGKYSITLFRKSCEADGRGTGSMANLASAATVAASSFSMTVSDPRPLLEAIDPAYLQECLGYQPFLKADEPEIKQQSFSYSEPYGTDGEEQVKTQKAPEPVEDDGPSAAGTGQPRSAADVIDGKVLLLGDFIDTDAVSRIRSKVPLPLTPVLPAQVLLHL
jgi:aconitase A